MPKIIIVSGPVIVENGRVLLNKHGSTSFWKFCGGRVEGDDTNLINSAEREAKEEMGIKIEIKDENPFITFTRQQAPDGAVDIILVHFLAKRIGNIKPGTEIKQWAWHDVNNLPPDLGINILPALRYFKFI